MTLWLANRIERGWRAPIELRRTWHCGLPIELRRGWRAPTELRMRHACGLPIMRRVKGLPTETAGLPIEETASWACNSYRRRQSWPGGACHMNVFRSLWDKKSREILWKYDRSICHFTTVSNKIVLLFIFGPFRVNVFDQNAWICISAEYLVACQASSVKSSRNHNFSKSTFFQSETCQINSSWVLASPCFSKKGACQILSKFIDC